MKGGRVPSYSWNQPQQKRSLWVEIIGIGTVLLVLNLLLVHQFFPSSGLKAVDVLFNIVVSLLLVYVYYTQTKILDSQTQLMSSEKEPDVYVNDYDIGSIRWDAKENLWEQGEKTDEEYDQMAKEIEAEMTSDHAFNFFDADVIVLRMSNYGNEVAKNLCVGLDLDFVLLFDDGNRQSFSIDDLEVALPTYPLSRRNQTIRPQLMNTIGGALGSDEKEIEFRSPLHFTVDDQTPKEDIIPASDVFSVIYGKCMSVQNVDTVLLGITIRLEYEDKAGNEHQHEITHVLTELEDGVSIEKAEDAGYTLGGRRGPDDINLDDYVEIP